MVSGFRIITILSLLVGVRSQTKNVVDVLISKGKPVRMSSTLNWKFLWSATSAVDGNERQDADICKCCASTNEGSDETFTLELENSYRISRIKILGRNDSQTGEISGLEVYVSSSPNTQDRTWIGRLSNNEEEVVQVNTSTAYQYVIVKSTTDKPNFVLICEIQVYTQECQNGFYDDCVKQCGQCDGDDVCNKTTGICPNRCKQGYQTDTCSKPCNAGYYGDCVTPCGNCKHVADCNNVNGHCSTGCKAGFKGDLCKTVCNAGYYGDCVTPCGNCKHVADCNNVNGHCSTGCKAGFEGDLCKTACNAGYYGDCVTPCGNCKHVADCNNVNGHCSTGCKAGFKGDLCKTVCNAGYYGDCVTPCGNCKHVADCNNVNGHCSTGCKAGFEGDLCKTACNAGYYGDCVTPCGNCKHVADCNNVNGHCPTGCKAGFKGDLCKTVCNAGYYGDCVTPCGNCKHVADCNNVNGHCSTGCKAGFEGDICKTACVKGMFGDGCNSICGHCLNDNTCNITTGFCAAGCASGYNGTYCNTSCPDGTYGPECENKCGSCIDNGVCNRFSGTCKLGCAAGYKGADCKTECPHGTFGENCNSLCHCANNATCDRGNGTCSNGQCDFGYTGISCSTDHNIIADYNTTVSMSSMWNDGNTDWGPELAIDNNARTNPDTCLCCSATQNEANSWWEIEFGDVIPIMNIQIYGRQPMSNQIKGAQIYLVNDTTLDLSDPFTTITSVSTNNYYNYTLPNTLVKAIRVVRPTGVLTLCEVKIYMGECKVGRFGGGCAQDCNCYDNMTCDFTNGTCQTPACKAGWKGPACDRECSRSHFGQNCSNMCHCYDNVSCNHVTGLCENDRCVPGWKEPTCSDEYNNNTFGENCTKTCNCVNACDHIRGICDLGGDCVGGWQGSTCSERIVTPKDESGSNTGLIAGLVTGAVVIAILAGVILVFIRRRKTGNLKENRFDGIDHKLPKPRDIPKSAELQNQPTVKAENIVSDRSGQDGKDNAGLNDIDDGSTYYNINTVNSGIKVTELWTYIKFKSLDNHKEFAKEYKSVPKNANKSTSIAMLPRNRIKCRYKAMYPYDENRVKLDTNGGQDGDFINASYIDGTEQRNKFIASQGPQKVMVDDFWRMVWEQKSSKIVMLTNIYENDSIKIVCYWSEKEDLIFGNLSIKVLSSVSTEDYDIRDMKMTHENEESHFVTQYHFKSWPDKDVPSTAWSLVDFWRKVNETKPVKQSGPIIVHCSAGVGRTGTFIALDCLCQEAARYGTVKPLHTLQSLREQRISMVQTLAQYVYLHEAVAEALYFGTHYVTENKFERLYEYMTGKDGESNKIRLEAQYELLTESLDQPLAAEKKTPVENEYGNVQSAQLEINAYRPRSKNRNSKSIQELRAIYLPTFGHGNGFILCKSPSEKLICGFWNLIDEENIKTIVMVADRTSKIKVPGDLGASSSAQEGRHVVKCISEKTTPSTVERTFTLKPAGSSNNPESTVNLFQYTAWKDGYVVPGDTTSVQSLLETVVQWHPLPSESQPILLCCGDGVTQSGLLCVLMNELYRIRKESGQINIIDSVKNMKHRQRHIITGFAQYQYCHDVIKEICRQNEQETQPNDTSSENEQLYQNL